MEIPMANAEDTTAAAVETSDDSTEATATEATTDTSAATGEEALGDAGKKALDAMKAKWKTEADERKKLAAEFEAFKAKADGKEAEFTAAQEAQRIKDEALAAANERILKAELRAAAKGKLTDPTDVFRFPEIVDLSALEVSADGEVDAAALDAAVNDLIARRPDLAAQGGKRFQGGADGGARKDAAATAQLTEADVKRLSAEGKYDDIAAAKADGRLNDYLGIK
jgi:hypothetical protein